MYHISYKVKITKDKGESPRAFILSGFQNNLESLTQSWGSYKKVSINYNS